MPRRDVTGEVPSNARRAGGRGKRDPALRQRIASDQPVYDEDLPDGVVARRSRPIEEEPVDANAEDYDGDEYEAGIEIDPEEFDDTGHGGDGMPPPRNDILLPGDVVYAKVTHAVTFDSDPSYFSYGVAAHIWDDETEEEAFDRIGSIVNTRSLDLAYAAEEHIEQLVDRVEKRRRERRNSDRGLRPRQSEEG